MKILILSCSTGGGHNAAANAIKEQFDMRNIDCDVKEYMINCQRKNIDRYSASHICDYIIKHMNDNILPVVQQSKVIKNKERY